MIAYDEYRTGLLPFVRRVRALREAGQLSLGGPQRVRAAQAAPVSSPAWVASPVLAPSGDARLLRRLRHVVRRRVRVDLDGLVAATVTDGELTLRIDTLSAREPHIVGWSADRLVALVILHDGCGARVIGGGGLMGRLELPSVTGCDAFLAFCYDAEASASLS
ncbi:MAG TPA: hypothetical protein VFQ75_08025 [Candidatus Limnocylindrales bacterium]|nr:hypothetical protein [Candidatus Limnocylindrales bacterium]